MKIAILMTILLLSVPLAEVQGGLLAYGICQTGCNALVVSCYAAAGFTFGTGKLLMCFYPLNDNF